MEPDFYALSKAGFSKERIEEITRCDDKEIQIRGIFSFAACGSEKNISQGSGGQSMGTSAQESSGKDDF